MFHYVPRLKAKRKLRVDSLARTGVPMPACTGVHQAGLTHVQMWPHFAAFEQPHTSQAQFTYGAILSALTADGNAGVARGHSAAVVDGTYFFTQPFHRAVGTKPETLRSREP